MTTIQRDYSITRQNQGFIFQIPFRGVTLQRNVIIGPGSTIGAHSFLTQSSVGKDVKIGKNVNIKNSIIFDKVVIRDNCQLDGAIVG